MAARVGAGGHSVGCRPVTIWSVHNLITNHCCVLAGTGARCTIGATNAVPRLLFCYCEDLLMANAGHTPADLVIHPRNVTFIRQHPAKRWWYANDPVATAYYNSLSVAFPLGEAFFIKSVMHFRNLVPAGLKAQVDDFIRQEATHSREHACLHDQVKASGYDLTAIETELSDKLSKARSNPPIVNLATTIALEHFTAVMAHTSLKSDRHMPGLSAEAAALWKWHAIEEIEHKAVAYDTFLAATQNMSDFRRWLLRSVVMLRVSKTFVTSRLRNMRHFFKQDRINTLNTWLRTAHFLLISPGIFRRIFPGWLAFFRPGFHPWNVDDRALVASQETKLLSIPSYREIASGLGPAAPEERGFGTKKPASPRA
jgi:predicted metal-dependent hydrolase